MSTSTNFLQEPVNDPPGEGKVSSMNKPEEIVANLQAALPKTGLSSVDNIISDMSQPFDFINSELENRRWPEL